MPRILVIDDCESIRTCLHRGLKLHGCLPAEAGSLEEALPMLPYFDGVIVDGLHGGGIHLLAACESRGIPAVLLSGDDELVERAQRVGFVSLRKPASIEAILAALRVGVTA